eukprot:scaffold3148_cov275-Pinguiococcus_pyrenoidosus.AAC.2
MATAFLVEEAWYRVETNYDHWLGAEDVEVGVTTQEDNFSQTKTCAPISQSTSLSRRTSGVCLPCRRSRRTLIGSGGATTPPCCSMTLVRSPFAFCIYAATTTASSMRHAERTRRDEPDQPRESDENRASV